MSAATEDWSALLLEPVLATWASATLWDALWASPPGSLRSAAGAELVRRAVGKPEEPDVRRIVAEAAG